MTVPIELIKANEADIHLATIIGALAFASDPMERFLFPATDEYLHAWFILSPLKLRYPMALGSCWVTSERNAIMRCVPPDASADPFREQRRREMARLLGDRMSRLDEIFREKIPGMWSESRRWELSSIAVDPNAQGKGIGTKMIRHAIDLAAGSAVPLCLVASSPKNAKLYESLGFQLLGRVPIDGGPVIFPMEYRNVA